ncbi:hypothetical protein K227x_37310 [Rubripirellula lacrimiformis]|uniref:Uncharacterized protein n=1 Tax=Rubripirellula lacrimiformis TaxID=1930273 RepID=A0A517NDY0_9BACT|nr:hypothetical protein [Rubripirellula lacrimiformis]QDT05331.1 hypothetical protein K227x_37310 [Rubripirellula lacrimiformis]
MNLTSLLETITNRQRQRRITKWSDYRRLVASICDGKEPDADKIATVLADNERTLDELRHDAELLARRRRLRDEYDAIAPLESEATKLAKQIDAAEQTLEALTAKHESEMSPLYIRRTEINTIRKRASQARMELRNTCEDRELVVEYDSVVEELSAADHARASLAEEMDKRESWARQDREKGKATPFKNEANRYKEQAEAHEAILADLRAKYEPAEYTVNALQERLSEIEDRLLDP